MIYFDNAATSFPKPIEVIRAVSNALSEYGANPGRSGHDFSLKTAEAVYSAREEINDFFGGYGCDLVSFAQNCTLALNQAIKGIINKGEHIVISSLEHNSVLRTVNALKENGIADYTVFEYSENEDELLKNFKNSLRENTKLCVVTAVSNVFGNILPLSKLAAISKEYNIVFLADGAQGAGIIDINMKKQGIDCLCVPGHKGLMGPMGTGMILHNGCIKNTLIEGGTGTSSFDLHQPESFPERLEAGTINVPGILGVKAGIRYIKKCGIGEIRKEESELTKILYEGLKNIKGVKLYTDFNEKKFAPLLSFNVNNYHSEEISSALNEQGIAVRGGFHCSPSAHKTYKTENVGTVRFSPSKYNGKKDVNILLNLVNKIAISGTV